MTPPDEPLDDWGRGEEAAQGAFLRGAIRIMLPAFAVIAVGIGIQLALLSLGILGVAQLPSGWIPIAVLYLCVLIAVDAAVSTRTAMRPVDDHRVLSDRTRWNRRIIGRVTTAPLAYLAFPACQHLVGSVPAGIITGALWVAPIPLALLRPKGLEQRMRALRGFMQGGEKGGPEA
jgi:hypothetical protein